MFKIAICDDNYIDAEEINCLLEEQEKKFLLKMDIDIFYSSEELIEYIQKSNTKYDIIYIDIEVKNLNGIQTAKKIREAKIPALLIFFSYHEKFLIDLFQVQPFRFLKKPIDKNKFEQVFRKAYKRLLDDEEYFEYKYNKGFHRVLLKDILHFESSGRYIIIVTKYEKTSFIGKMNDVEKKLENKRMPFIRIHQSVLVNYLYVKVFQYTKVILINNVELKISQERQKEIKGKYIEQLEKGV